MLNTNWRIIQKIAIVRYLVDNVEESVSFYTQILGFTLIMSGGKDFAKIGKDDLTIWVSGPQSSAAKPMPNEAKPVPEGWNRFVIEVDSMHEMVVALKAANVNFRNDVVNRVGGKQVLVEDPSGNPIEIFQSK